MLKCTDIRKILIASAVLFVALAASAQTPKLKIKTKSGLPGEEQRKQQIERLARQYDLKKYTITRDILVEHGAINHSHPTLTLNLRFLDNDDLALSAYVHEQAHWVMMDRLRLDNPRLLDDLRRAFPTLDFRVPEGDGELRTSYFHIAVCMLEWQAMEELVGPERARKVIEWKQGDHYKSIYSIVLNQRAMVESIQNSHGVRW
jgi:hypothetical protein